MLVGEDQPAGRFGIGSGRYIGIAGDPDQTLVMHTVMLSTQQNRVRGDGRSPVLPVDDVMYLQPVASVASRNPALIPVTMLDKSTEPLGRIAKRCGGRDRNTLAFPH